MTKKIKIYIFGNELLDFDNLPLKLVPQLKKGFSSIDFIIQDPTENIKPSAKGELIIIDTVMGIKEVKIFHDIDKIETEKIYSMHDFDLAFNLKLLKKIEKLKKVIIFGVPPKMNEKIALKQLIKLLPINL